MLACSSTRAADGSALLVERGDDALVAEIYRNGGR
jgi:hypothetical protein